MGLVGALCLATGAQAAPDLGGCFEQAARFHHVNPQLLRAIASHESGQRADAINTNTNGSRDIGMMQINTGWLPELAKHGIREADLYDACTNIFVGAWILAKGMKQHGNTWRAVGAYHSNNPDLNERYAWAIYNRLQRSKQ